MDTIEQKIINFMKRYKHLLEKPAEKINWTLIYELLESDLDVPEYGICSFTAKVIDRVHPEDYMRDIPPYYIAGLILKDNQIHLREGIQTIGTNAFQSSDIKEIIIPSSVNTIGSYCFDDCTNLETVIFKEPSLVKRIPNYTFRGCIGLKTITLPLVITSIGRKAFAYTGLETITLRGGLHINDYAFEETPLKEIIFKGRKEDFNLQVDLSAKALEGCPIRTITCDNGEIQI